MQTTETESDGVLIIAAQGRLDSNTSEAFNQRLSDAIDGEHYKIIVDFSKLEYISSAGLRVLLIAAKRLKAENGSFAIAGVESHIREVFEISGFLQILNITENITEARASMG